MASLFIGLPEDSLNFTLPTMRKLLLKVEYYVFASIFTNEKFTKKLEFLQNNEKPIFYFCCQKFWIHLNISFIIIIANITITVQKNTPNITASSGCPIFPSP